MEEMTIPISENIIEVEIICTDFHCPCLLAGEKKLHTETMTKKTNEEIETIWKKRTYSWVLKGRKHKVARKISVGGNNRELWRK